MYYSEKLPEFSQTVLEHDVLKKQLNDTSCGKQLKKHLLQNASLLRHLEQANLVKSDTCFIEFGAGRGIYIFSLNSSSDIYKSKMEHT